jgi:hypothetical protein
MERRMRTALVLVMVGLSVAACAGPANRLSNDVENVAVCRVADTPRCAEELARAQQERAYALTDPQAPTQATAPWQDPAGGPRSGGSMPDTVFVGSGPSPLQEAVVVPVPAAPVFPGFNTPPLPADGRNPSFNQRVLDTRSAGPR